MGKKTVFDILYSVESTLPYVLFLWLNVCKNTCTIGRNKLMPAYFIAHLIDFWAQEGLAKETSKVLSIALQY